ncbi:MAG TPA: HAMP domain-containing methyl-accepting chemotaxis protein, partial [Alphaproteobacteria bacterium]|nr:HAMP domain-containing methyl-accepting chemotaxis protein [Alphaproteobacteria bacterium]
FVVVSIVTVNVWESWQRLGESGRVLAIADASGHAFKAMHNLRTDRSSTTRNLNAAGSLDPEGEKYLRQIRDAQMPALKAASELLEAIEFADRKTLLPELQRSVKVITALQTEAWDAFKGQKTPRREQMAKEYMAEATKLLDTLEKISLRLNAAVKGKDPFIDQMLVLKQLAWTVRNSGGEASVLVSQGLAAGKLPPETRLRFHYHRGASEVAWAALEEAAFGAQLPPKLAEAIANAKKNFFDAEHMKLREKLLEMLLAGEKPEMSANQWSPITVGKLASVLPVAEGALDTAKVHASEVYAAAQRGLALGVLAFLAAVLFTVGAMVAVNRHVLNPLRVMRDAMLKVAAGDLTAEAAYMDRTDEIGALAGALGTFKQNAADKARFEAEQAERHAQAASRQKAIEAHIAAFESQVREALEALGTASSQMRQTSDSMSATSDQTNRQVKTAASASADASTNVQTVAAASEELDASIAEISRQVAHAATIAGRAVDETHQTDATVQSLAETAARIGEVVKLINDIAAQTNLLALNATIEAARAGEAGKGFAVVASEVKSLANQTAKATEEISAQIAAVQNVTQNAVDAIKRIGGTIGEVSTVATSIASAVEEQGAATKEITRNTQEAARRTKDVSENVAGVASGADATGAAAQGVKSAAEALGVQTDRLRHQVDDFLAKIRAA